jgi:hypothetical protein
MIASTRARSAEFFQVLRPQNGPAVASVQMGPWADESEISRKGSLYVGIFWKQFGIVLLNYPDIVAEPLRDLVDAHTS